MREMKNSGIEWIGEIPHNWKVIKNKYLLDEMYSGGTPTATNESFYSDDENSINFCSISDMSSVSEVYKTNKKITESGRKDKNLKILEEGTILYSIYATVGEVSQLKIKSTISQAMLALMTKENIDKQYYKYCLKSMKDYIFIDANGNTQFNLNAEKVKNFFFPFPSCGEQTRIANFLDKKVSEIDNAIEKTKQSIEEYKKLKQSIITEAVTKGLNPDTEMKDSGIEWIGKIPSNWEVIKIGKMVSLRDEKNYKPLNEVNLISLYTDKGVVQHSDLEETSGNKAQNADGYKFVYQNDIVVNIILAWMGAIGISKYNGVTSPAYDVYKPNENLMNPKYYHYVLRTKAFAGECYKYGRGIMMMRWRTYSNEFKQIVVPHPSIREQNEIADFLDQKCSSLSDLISKKEHIINELEHYKKSLIYEYVTGKRSAY